jgi:hypothetical protein
MTVGLFGLGFIEMLARQMTADLQGIRDAIPPSGSAALVSKGVRFGIIKRDADGAWDTSRVEGLPALSLATFGPGNPPSLIMRPFHQAGRVASTANSPTTPPSSITAYSQANALAEEPTRTETGSLTR